MYQKQIRCKSTEFLHGITFYLKFLRVIFKLLNVRFLQKILYPNIGVIVTLLNCCLLATLSYIYSSLFSCPRIGNNVEYQEKLYSKWTLLGLSVVKISFIEMTQAFRPQDQKEVFIQISIFVN